MSLTIVSALDTAPVRWKNNGGWTRELLAWPQAQGWALRISVADIEADGPFSTFPGVDRFFAVLSGEGVALDIDGTPHTLITDSPLQAFTGEAATGCRLLGGATRDFNLMVQRASVAVRVWPASQAAVLLDDAHWSGLFTVAGGRAREADSDWQTVPPLSLVWRAGAAPWEADVGARAWWMQARLLPSFKETSA